jgi:hypothetical protein
MSKIVMVLIFLSTIAIASDLDLVTSLRDINESIELSNQIQTFSLGYPQIKSVTLTSDGKLEVICREESNIVLLSNPPQSQPPIIWKNIYACKDGKIVLEKRVYAKVTPEHTIPESYEWEGDEK